jgi:hypothetical protein
VRSRRCTQEKRKDKGRERFNETDKDEGGGGELKGWLGTRGSGRKFL